MKITKRRLITCVILYYAAIGLTYVLCVSNSTYTGVYDELISPHQIPHHQLMESGWPFKAATYWTRCTTFPVSYNWIWQGVVSNHLVSMGVVYSLYYLTFLKKPVEREN